MKRCPLLSAAWLVLLTAGLLTGTRFDESVYATPAQADAVTATSLHDAGAALSSGAAVTTAWLIEPVDGRVTRSSHADTARTAPGDHGRSNADIRDSAHSHSSDMAARLARAGIHDSALGTPPPHA